MFLYGFDLFFVGTFLVVLGVFLFFVLMVFFLLRYIGEFAVPMSKCAIFLYNLPHFKAKFNTRISVKHVVYYHDIYPKCKK
ncbi:MAG: hypothetical protein BZ136_07585 [Methanosphaera sp. rholeuAM74]|nr:MAG: hypothetical protein BZ136_07585 [Methanosphaera sp. rholeuAM74]